ncbi:MAG TPA: hypothetical protein VF852_11250 [Pseudolabrys sp.]
MSELACNRYQGKVASLDRLNAYTIARHELIIRILSFRFTTSATLKSAKAIAFWMSTAVTLRSEALSGTRHMRKLVQQ